MFFISVICRTFQTFQLSATVRLDEGLFVIWSHLIWPKRIIIEIGSIGSEYFTSPITVIESSEQNV